MSSYTTSNKSTCAVQSNYTRECGIGLIEVVVALLGIGLLMSASMQMKGLQELQLSSQYSQAMMLADDIMDRMLSNREGVEAGYYDGIQIADVTQPACVTTGCDAPGLAQLDHFEWSSHLLNVRQNSDFIPALPVSRDGSSATASVSAPDDAGVYTINIDWKRQDGTDISESLTVRFNQ